jgi:kynurenine formamidase
MPDVPLERLYGQGVLYRVEVGRAGVVEPDHLLASGPPPEPGDIVLIDTGSHRVINTPEYADAPSLSPTTASWLRDHRVKLVGIDASTPDQPAHRRYPGFDWPVHRILLASGVLIAEHMANLHTLEPGPIEAVFGVIAFEGADAGPARVVGRNVH